MPAPWVSVLEELQKRHPFLGRMRLTGKQCKDPPVPLPAIIQYTVALAAVRQKATGPGNRLAVVFPRAFDTPSWVAVGAAIAVAQREWPQHVNVNAPLDFRPGETLYLDDKPHLRVRFEEEKRSGGQRFIRVKTNGGYIDLLFERRFRLSRTSSAGPLAVAKTFQKQLNRVQESSVLERLVDASTPGSVRTVANGVILLSRIGANQLLSRSTTVSLSNGPVCETGLQDLFLWGSLSENGEVEPWGPGQAASDPLVIVTHLPDLARKYVAKCKVSPLLLLDGPDSLRAAPDIVSGLLDRNLPTLAVLEERDCTPDVRDFLDKHGFAVWRWAKEDLNQPPLTPPADVAPPDGQPFGQLLLSLRHFIGQEEKAEPVESGDDLSQAAGELFRLGRKIDADNPAIPPILGRFYGSLLGLARLLRPLEGNACEEQIDRAAAELRAFQLLPEAVFLVDQVAGHLKRVVDQFRQGVPKVVALEKVLDTMAGEGLTAGVVVLADEQEADGTRRYWQPRLARWPSLRVRFASLSGVRDGDNLDFLVACGWLKQQRMFRLLGSYAVRRTVVLTYPFERAWHDGAIRQWRRRGSGETERGLRNRLLGVPPEKGDLSFPGEGEESSDRDETSWRDVREFEFRLEDARMKNREAGRQTLPDEESVEGWYVRFTDGSHAYLTEGHRVLVVSDLPDLTATSRQSLPQKKVADLHPGDLIVFPAGADADVIRRQADLGLCRAGQEHLREEAGLWRKALKDFTRRQPEGLGGVVRALEREGCLRTLLTIRNWIHTDDTIGPQDVENDLAAIASATGDQRLAHKLEAIGEAIKTVRSAHLQASSHIQAELVRALPRLLSGGRLAPQALEIEGLGQLLIVEIEYIDSEPTSIEPGDANRLCAEG
jgi:hypothetical protein